MRVIAAVNGQITSEVAADYALRFAGVNNLPLVLLHIVNPKDDIRAVENGMESVEKQAGRYGVSTQRVILEGRSMAALQRYIAANKTEILFCSTRYMRKKMFSTPSFSEKLIAANLAVDAAVVRVVHPYASLSVERVVLPIKENRVSVEKFSFFASMVKSLKARGEIYSVTVLAKKKKAGLDLGDTRKMLQKIDDRLAHYKQLARHMGISLKVKHAIAENEIDQVLHHVARKDFQLMIVGGERLSIYSVFTKSKPIERLLRCTPVNTIAFYRRGVAR